MADESLSAFISVETDALTAGEQISQLPQIVGQTVTQVNEQLGRLAQENPFARVITDAERAALSIEQIQQAAEATAAALGIVADANARLQASGTSARVTGAGGISVAEIESQNAALATQLEILRQEVALQQELRASSRFIPADGGSVRGSASPSGLFGRGLPFTGGTQPGTAFYSDAELAEMKRQEAISSARNLLINESRSTKPLVDPGTELGALTAVPIDIREDFAAIANAMSEGAAQFEGKSVIAVREAFAGINGAIEPGFYSARTGQPLSAMDQLYLGGKSGFMGAGGGGGGGGFIGNFFQGISGGGPGGGGLGDLGTQAGIIGRYVLIYQVFRDIERSIKESVDQALAFDRAVTDIGNRLQLSHQQAQQLADSVGQVGAQAGLGPGETIQHATTYAGAFAGQASQSELLGVGAQTAAQVQILTGKVKDDLPDVIAAVQAFNLNFSDTQRVLDAATSSAQNYGLANAHDVLPGLAQIGDLAAQSGFSVEQTANAIADIVTRTHDTSQAVAGQLQRFLGREGNPAFQQVFAQQGIDTSQSFSQELEQLSERFDKLSESQKGFIAGQFGGGRAGVAALAFIEDYARILDNTHKSLEAGGVAQKNYENRLNDIVGAITAVRGELKELAKDVGTSGIGAGFGVAVEAAKPLLEILDEIVRLVNFLDSAGGHFPIGRDLVIAAAEISAAVALLGRANLGARIGGIFGRNRGEAETTPTGVSADKTAASLDRLAAAADKTAAALDGDAAAAGTDATAKKADATATETDAAAKRADAVATDENAVAQQAGALGAARGALGKLAGIFGAEGGIGVGVGGLLGAAGSVAGIIGGALVVQKQFDTIRPLIRAETSAQNAGTTAFDVNNDSASLQDQAQKLREQAQKAESASGGLFGSLDNLAGAALGHVGLSRTTETTGDIASRDRQYADLLQLESRRADAAKAASTAGGDFADLINVGKQGGVADGLKTLAALGLDSAQQLDALNTKLQAFADAASGAANYLTPGASASAGQNYANQVVNDFIALAKGAQVGGYANSAENRVAGKDFAGNVAPGLNQVLSDTTREFLTSYEGGNVDSGARLQLAAEAKQAMVRYLQSHGFSAQDIAKLGIELNDATLAATQEVIAQINAAAGQAISPDAVGAVVQGLPGLLSGTAQSITQRAQLGQIGPDAILGPTTVDAPQGTQVAGLQAALTKAQNTYNSLLRTPGVTGEDLQGVRDQIVAYRTQIQTATLQNIDAQGQLAIASIPPENQTAQINAHIALIQQELASTKNPDDITNLRTQLAGLSQQAAASAAQDAISGIGVGTDPRNTVAVASDAARQAAATAASLSQRGVTGQALNNALKAVAQADQAYADAKRQQANEAIAANVRSGDQLSEARAGLVEARNTLVGDIPGQGKYFADLKAVHDAEAALAKAIAENAKTTFLLHHDFTDPVAEAEATLRQAQTQYNQDRAKHTGNLANDQLGVEQAQWAEQKAKFDQQMSLQSDAYDLRQETAQQYLKFLEGQDAHLRSQLAGMKKSSAGYRQLVDELTAVDKEILNLSDSVSGQFNLGDIITPTVYEARRMAQAQQAGTAYNDNKTVIISINGADPGSSADFYAALDEHLGTNISVAAGAVAPGGRKY